MRSSFWTQNSEIIFIHDRLVSVAIPSRKFITIEGKKRKKKKNRQIREIRRLVEVVFHERPIPTMVDAWLTDSLRSRKANGVQPDDSAAAGAHQGHPAKNTRQIVFKRVPPPAAIVCPLSVNHAPWTRTIRTFNGCRLICDLAIYHYSA